MTISIIIALCTLLLFAYFFDITASKTKIPSVILLLALGFVVRQLTMMWGITVPDLSAVLPVLGTVGLTLIVLEGSLELELDKTKLPTIGKTALIALLPLLVLSLSLGYMFHYWGNVPFKIALANAIPFAIISSAIAIPSAKNLYHREREFITYESSFSDIFGVIFFNFITLNDNIGTESLEHFFLEILLILIVTFISTLVLAYLLGKIKSHVKYAPIIIMIILIYAISKVYHLPGLIFLMLFGLFLGNLDRINTIISVEKLHPEILDKEVEKFKDLTAEITFLIRALFFLMFGYSIEMSELLNSSTALWAVSITLGIYLLRAGFLKMFRLAVHPLVFLAPRGLITILLFLSIPITQSIEIANKSLIIQVIILTAVSMMVGLIFNKTSSIKEIDK